MKTNRTSFNAFRKNIVKVKSSYSDSIRFGETLIPTGQDTSTITLPTIEDTVFYEVLKTEKLESGFGIGIASNTGHFKGLVLQPREGGGISVLKVSKQQNYKFIGFNLNTENGTKLHFISEGNDWFVWGVSSVVGGVSANNFPYINMTPSFGRYGQPTQNDLDGDGLTNIDEQTIYNTDPTNPDSDGDLVEDAPEIILGTDPVDPDSTPIPLLDTDGDGIPDVQEILDGTDSNDPSSFLGANQQTVDTPPIIEGINYKLGIEAGITEQNAINLILEGLIATDSEDGDITNDIVVNIPNFSNNHGDSFSATISVTDSGGNTAEYQVNYLVQDTTAPAAPIITSHSNNQSINISTQTISGTAETGSLIELTFNETIVGSTIALGGSWSFENIEFTEGSNSISVTSEDIYGNLSNSSTINVTLDTIGPTITLISVIDGNDVIINENDQILPDSTLTFIGSINDNNASISCSNGEQGVNNGNGSWSFTTSNLGQGSVTFIFTATDLANNTSQVQFSFVNGIVENSTSSFDIAANPSSITNASTPIPEEPELIQPSVVTSPMSIQTSAFGLSSFDSRAISISIKFKTTLVENDNTKFINILRFYNTDGATVYQTIRINRNSIQFISGGGILGNFTILTSTNNFLDGTIKNLVLVLDKVWSDGYNWRSYCAISNEDGTIIEHASKIFYNYTPPSNYNTAISQQPPLTTTKVDVGPATLTAGSFQFKHLEIIQDHLATPNQIEDYFTDKIYLLTSLENIVDNRAPVLANSYATANEAVFNGSGGWINRTNGLKYSLMNWSQNYLPGKTFTFNVYPQYYVQSVANDGTGRPTAVFSYVKNDGLSPANWGGWSVGLKKMVYNDTGDYQYKLLFAWSTQKQGVPANGFLSENSNLTFNSRTFIYETEVVQITPYSFIAFKILEEQQNGSTLSENIVFYVNGVKVNTFLRTSGSLTPNYLMDYRHWANSTFYNSTIVPDGETKTYANSDYCFRIGWEVNLDANFIGRLKNVKVWYGGMSESQILAEKEISGNIEYFTFSNASYLDNSNNEVLMTGNTYIKSDFIGKVITFRGLAVSGKTIEVYRNNTKIGETVSINQFWEFEYTFLSNDDYNYFKFIALINNVEQSYDFAISKLDSSNKFLEEPIGLRVGNASLEGSNLELNRGSTGLLNYSSDIATFDSIVQRWDPALTNTNLSYFSDLPVDLRIPNGGGITYNKQRGNIYSLWIKSNDSGDMPIFDFANHNDPVGSNGSGSRLLYTSSTNILKIQNNWDSPYNNYIDINLGTYFPGLVLNDGNWHHIIIQNKIWDTTVPTNTNSERWYRKMDLIIDGVKITFNKDRQKSIATATYEIFRSSSRVLVGAYASGITNLSTYAPATSNCSIDQFQILDGYYLNDTQIQNFAAIPREQRVLLKDFFSV